MPDPTGPWDVEKFDEEFDRWADLEQPGPDLRYFVFEWVFTRRDNPYAGAKPNAQVEGLWFAVIPGSFHGHGDLVTCSYFVDGPGRLVRCTSFSSLSPPFIED